MARRKSARVMDIREPKKHKCEKQNLQVEVEVVEGQAEEPKKVNPFLRSWAWKREHRPDRDRFRNPYEHKIKIGREARTLVLHQAPFSTTGFASTVWDSAIVLAKYLEKWPEIVAGKKCIELGAGCGLAGLTAAAMGAKKVILTDYPENIPLLDRNCLSNDLAEVATTMPLTWGIDPDWEENNFDIILGTDIMYYDDAVKPLLATLQSLSGRHTRIFFAYGRNRQAEDTFMRALEEFKFKLKHVAEAELDDVYHCEDVDVYELNTNKSEECSLA